MAPSPRPHLRSSTAGVLCAATALCLVGAALTVPASARPVRPDTARRHSGSSVVTLARGVTLQHVDMRSDGRAEQVTLLGIDFKTPGVEVDATSPDGVVGADRATVKAQTNARHAVAGVNADFFNLNRSAAAPRGTLVSSGQMLKSPAAPRNANLVLRHTAKGEVASIGALPFTGEVTRVRKNTRNRTRSLTTTNSLVSARAGGLVLLTPAMAASDLRRSCRIATGTQSHGVWTVRSVGTTFTTPRLAANAFALLSCAGHGAHWIHATLRRGDTVRVSDAVTGGTPWAAVSGGSVLVRNGKAWSDPLGEHLPYPGRNAETFACTGRSGHRLTLGTVDGYTWQSAGVTYSELTSYLVSLGCWSGMVLDGGGSTTLVAKLPGTSKARIQNAPATRPARPVADSLVVFGG